MSQFDVMDCNIDMVHLISQEGEITKMLKFGVDHSGLITRKCKSSDELVTEIHLPNIKHATLQTVSLFISMHSGQPSAMAMKKENKKRKAQIESTHGWRGWPEHQITNAARKNAEFVNVENAVLEELKAAAIYLEVKNLELLITAKQSFVGTNDQFKEFLLSVGYGYSNTYCHHGGDEPKTQSEESKQTDAAENQEFILYGFYPDVINNICSFLPFKNICVLAGTSKVGQDITVCQLKNLKKVDLRKTNFEVVSEYCEHLQEIDVWHGVDDVKLKQSGIFKKNNNISRVTLHKPPTKLFLSILCDAQLQTLEEFSCCMNIFSQLHQRDVERSLDITPFFKHYGKRLTKLTLQYKIPFEWKDIGAFCPDLEYFYASTYSVFGNDRPPYGFVEALQKQCPKLSYLHISVNDRIVGELGHLKQLQELDIFLKGRNPSVLGIQNLPNLTELNLRPSWSPYTLPGMMQVALCCQKLKKLVLPTHDRGGFECALDDKLLFLRNCPQSLEELEISKISKILIELNNDNVVLGSLKKLSCIISMPGCEVLGDVLPNIKHLNIPCRAVDTECVKELYRGRLDFEYLNIQDTRVNLEGFEFLAQAHVFPNLKILKIGSYSELMQRPDVFRTHKKGCIVQLLPN